MRYVRGKAKGRGRTRGWPLEQASNDTNHRVFASTAAAVAHYRLSVPPAVRLSEAPIFAITTVRLVILLRHPVADWSWPHLHHLSDDFLLLLLSPGINEPTLWSISISLFLSIFELICWMFFSQDFFSNYLEEVSSWLRLVSMLEQAER